MPGRPLTTVTDLPAPFLMSDQKKITLSAANTADSIPTQNVVAIWEGGDPVLKNEYVAIGAHYDHVGICAPGQADQICNGADDDGSGSVTLMVLRDLCA